MSDATPDGPSDNLGSAPARRFPTAVQLFVLLGGGFLLAFGSCFGGLATATAHPDLTQFFVVAFGLGVVMMIVGFGAALVAIVKAIFWRK